MAVYERDDRIGGLLRYGIPDFKMEKKHLESRLRQMQDEGTRFRAGVAIGKDITWSDLRARYDAVVIATGATIPRELAIPGRDLAGVHFAMEYLVESNKATAGDSVSAPDLTPRASTWWSSAAVTPAPTASARRTVRAR